MSNLTVVDEKSWEHALLHLVTLVTKIYQQVFSGPG
jgi:hypothetical protein